MPMESQQLRSCKEVLNLINFNESGVASRRPIGALVNAFPISRVVFNLTIVNLDVANAPAVQSDIFDAITIYLRQREPYIIGLSANPRRDQITQSAISSIVENIVSSVGGTFDSVIVAQLATTVSVYTLGIGVKAKLGIINYVYFRSI